MRARVCKIILYLEKEIIIFMVNGVKAASLDVTVTCHEVLLKFTNMLCEMEHMTQIAEVTLQVDGDYTRHRCMLAI